MLFGLVDGYLTVCRWEVLQKSYFLAALGLLMLVGYVVLARVYWFNAPLIGSLWPRCSTLRDLLAHLRANENLSSAEGIRRLDNPMPLQSLENYTGVAICGQLYMSNMPGCSQISCRCPIMVG